MKLSIIPQNMKFNAKNRLQKLAIPGLAGHLKEQGLLVKTTLLCWSVIVITIIVFLIIFTPYQKQLIIDNMLAKAKVMATSIAQITNKSIVEQNYSSLVDHCMKILNNNKSILYLVITRKDGYSLIHLRDKWYHRNLDNFWRPDLDKFPPGPLYQKRSRGARGSPLFLSHQPFRR